MGNSIKPSSKQRKRSQTRRTKLTTKVKKTEQFTLLTVSYNMIDDSLGGMRPRLQEKCLFALVLLGVFAMFLTIFSERLFALMLLVVVIAIFLAIIVSICLGVLVLLA